MARRPSPDPFLAALVVIGLIGGTAILLGDDPDRRAPERPLPFGLATDPDRAALVAVFEREADRAGLAPELLMALAWRESRWHQDDVSEDGAVGVGQLIPSTARFVADDILAEPHLDPLVVEDNIRLSAAYLAWLLERSGGDLGAALAGYVQGPRSVRDEGRFGVTDAYVLDVLALRADFAPPIPRTAG